MRALIVAALLFVFVLSGIIALGGVHYHRLADYLPMPHSRAGSSESDFVPSMFVEFQQGTAPRREIMIPYLFYRESMYNQKPHIRINLTDSTLSYGYIGKLELVIESFRVTNSLGDEFNLVSSGAPKRLSFANTPQGWRHVDLGSVEGDILNVAAQGYVVTISGEKKRFFHTDRWEKSTSTQIGLGIMFAE